MSRIDRRAFLKASGGTAALGLLAGCSEGGGGGPGRTTEGTGGTEGGGGTTTGTTGGGGGGSSGAITIGALEPVSGPFAPWATPHRDGLQFAVDQINADGGVLGGRNLEVTVSDTGAEPGTADSSFRRMVEQQGVVATTGAVSSDVGLRIAQTAKELEVPHLLHMSGADEVINQSTRYVFRVGLLPASQYMRAQASAYADAGYSKVGAIVGDYAWGRSAQEAIGGAFDMDVDVKVAPVGASDFSSYLRQFPSDLEMLIASGHPPGSVSIANQAYELGLQPEVVTGASTPPQLLAGALSDRAMEGYVHIHNSNPYGQPFRDAGSAFAEGHDQMFNTHTAYGYVTAQALAAAIEEAGSAEPKAVANAMRNIQVDSLFAEPLQWTQNGQLDNAVVLYSKLRSNAPSYDSEGNHSYEEVARSNPITAQGGN